MATGAGATGATAMTGVSGAGATVTTAMIGMAAAAADTTGARVTATATAEAGGATAMIATTVRCAMFPAIAGDPAPEAPLPCHRYRKIHVRAAMAGAYGTGVTDAAAGMAEAGLPETISTQQS